MDTNGTETAKVFCGAVLNFVSQSYRPVHGFVSIVVCFFGTVANLVTVSVLLKKSMASPTNAILCAMAVADIIVMVEYIPYAWHFYVPTTNSVESRYSYGWAVFVLLHSYWSLAFHNVSISLTITLAVWRFIAAAYTHHNTVWCNLRRAKIAIHCCYLIPLLLNIPLILSYGIEENTVPNKSGTNITIYIVRFSELGLENDSLLINVNFWIYSVIFKIGPCIALTTLIFGIAKALNDTKKRREALFSGARRSARDEENERQANCTTIMLLVVVIIFLISELPQGILGLLTIFFGRHFFEDCYLKLGEVIDTVTLLSSAINFIIYCSMSSQFRTTFCQLFRPRWLPGPTVDNGII